jgi:hypothetical protein
MKRRRTLEMTLYHFDALCCINSCEVSKSFADPAPCPLCIPVHSFAFIHWVFPARTPSFSSWGFDKISTVFKTPHFLFFFLPHCSPSLLVKSVRDSSEPCLSLLFGDLIHSRTGLDHILSPANLAYPRSPRRPMGFVGHPGGSSVQEPATFSPSTTTHPILCISNNNSRNSSGAAKATT